ncbi:NAD(P)-dependent oxidoreductase [Kribbella sp. CA-293567]|uniref:NAD(P)-dependent oxidoreductase n=1 Tax=Kribbella sp. CA-293567 TaxID=3002436 RepID=UPI0022DE51DF|nr:NAD(P)H-binding protein [Kribbella sp. CA-293567]WBQ08048.1 NAD(P)H-binding protein [Kribbella sp. CA-293567]
MRITIFGATGAVGSRVVAEAVARGHKVTAVGRNEQRLRALVAGMTETEVTKNGGGQRALASGADETDVSSGGGMRVQRGDASDPAEVARLSRGQDVVIAATRPVVGQEGELAIAAKGLTAGLAGSGVRLLMVGGAASLTLPGNPGTTVVEQAGFPVELLPIALACNEQLEVVRGSSGVDWTYLSPPAVLEPGTRTGNYRVGRDELLVAPGGTSYLSMEDFAVALIDEAEKPLHRGVRFTVGS